MAKKLIRRRWDLDHNGIRRIGNKERGFEFRESDGRPIRDARALERIRKLRIPPAWKSVRIARGAGAPLQAVGVDSKGRTQYLYHPQFRQRMDDAKFLRLVEFAESLPRLRREVQRELDREGEDRQRVIAAIVRLIDQGFFRVGNDKSARNEATYGLTTVTADHVHLEGSEIHFDYIGKWRKTQQRVIVDSDVARLIRKLEQMPGEEVFKFVSGSKVVDVKDRHVNDYIQAIIGPNYTAKDFRTWAGTLLCSIALAMQEPVETKAARKKKIKAAIQATATALGNTPVVCRKSYICPRLLDEYIAGRPFEPLRRTRKGSPVARRGHSKEERVLIRFLRETIANRRGTPRAT